jgi:type IV secretory pathway TraG/TraD family ATPase VirD4
MTRPTLADVFDLLTDPDFADPNSGLVYEMAMLGGPARSAAAIITQTDGETLGSFLSNAHLNMNWLESPARREGFSEADFSPLDINDGNTAVFYVEPLEQLGVNPRPERLVLDTFIDAALKGRKQRGKGSTLFIIDEAFSLDRLESLPKIVATLRGFGARVWLLWQGKGQANELYGKNAETFFTNAGQTQVFAINDQEGAEYVSHRIGQYVRWALKKIQSKDGIQEEFQPSAACFLRDGPEINRVTSRAGRLQIVLNEGGDPFLLRRTSYRKMFKPGQYDPDPYEPRPFSVSEAAMRLLRGTVMKFKEWWS